MKCIYGLCAVGLFMMVTSCGIFKHRADDPFYNKRNELRVKSKRGLFPGKHITFGGYQTSRKEKGVDSKIISFKRQRSPFHFSLDGPAGNATSVQATYTDAGDLGATSLPRMFDSLTHAELFYAWIRGGTVNALKNWELILNNPTYQDMIDRREVGVFRSLDESISVHASDRFATGTSSHPLSFEFRLKGVPVAAVRVNGDEKIWMDRQLNEETRFALAGAMAALLMR
jgi:hypothetical protein